MCRYHLSDYTCGEHNNGTGREFWVEFNGNGSTEVYIYFYCH